MTEKLFYENAYTAEFDARVLVCKAHRDGFETILDRTAFFPEGGGQRGDAGKIGDVAVFDTVEREGEILHLSREPVPVGETLPCSIDFATRFERMQCHSGEHIVSGIVHSLYGFDNVGFHLGDGDMTLDFDKELTDGQVLRLERMANEAVAKDIAVEAEFPSPEELEELEFRSKKELSEAIRIVTIDGYDVCACCAPHVRSTGQIGMIKLLDRVRWKGGVRIRAKCGFSALDD